MPWPTDPPTYPIVNGVIPEMDMQELLSSLFSQHDLESIGTSRLQGEKEGTVEGGSLAELAARLEALTSDAEEYERDVQSAKASLLDALRQRARARGRAATVRDALRRKL